MKYFLGILLFACFLVAGVNNIKADKPDHGNISPISTAGTNIDFPKDSLNTSSSTDEVVFDLGYVYSPQAITFQVIADSISGSTSGTCYLQLASDMGDTDFVNIDTIIINGVETQAIIEDVFIRGHLQCTCSAPSGTQKTYIWADFASFGTNLTTSWGGS